MLCWFGPFIDGLNIVNRCWHGLVFWEEIQKEKKKKKIRQQLDFPQREKKKANFDWPSENIQKQMAEFLWNFTMPLHFFFLVFPSSFFINKRNASNYLRYERKACFETDWYYSWRYVLKHSKKNRKEELGSSLSFLPYLILSFLLFIVVDEGFQSDMLLSVKYGDEDVAIGNHLTTSQTAEAPQVQFLPVEEDTEYSLFLVRQKRTAVQYILLLFLYLIILCRLIRMPRQDQTPSTDLGDIG